MSDIKPQWLLATLNDALETLQAAVDKLEEHPELADEVLDEDLVQAYAKLNYATNTAELGEAGLSSLTDDELIAWPPTMPFWFEDEIESLEDLSTN